MQTAATPKKPASRAAAIHQIGQDAVALGVHRTTLFRTLTGRTANPQLLARYNDLIRLRSKSTPETV